MAILPIISLFSFLTSLAAADLQFVSPAAGSTVPGTQSLQVIWQESGLAPLLSQLSTYDLYLYAGGNDAASMTQLALLVTQGNFATGNQVLVPVASDLGANVPVNAYFLKMVSKATGGGTVINYSNRFSMSGMAGSLPSSVIVAMQKISGVAGPQRQDNVINADLASMANAAPSPVDSFHLTNSMQTRLTRYAPMQSFPGTKITKTKKTPLYPTSPFTVAIAYLSPPYPTMTITLPVISSHSQRVNQEVPASHPTKDNDKQKFLKRWAN